MKDVMFEEIDLEKCTITDVSAVEKAYDYFEVTCYIDGECCRILDTRNSRISDIVFTDTQHEVNHAEWLFEKLGGNVKKMTYIFNHNSSTWEEPIGEFDGYYCDGLDHIEELWYID